MGLLAPLRRIRMRLSRAHLLAISMPIPLEGGGYVVATATATGITQHRAETLEDAKSCHKAIIAGLNTGAGGFPVDVRVIEEARSVAEFEVAAREYLGLPSHPSRRTSGNSSDSETP
jgi:hypothetical protein